MQDTEQNEENKMQKGDAQSSEMPEIPALTYDTNPTPSFDEAAQRLWFAEKEELNKQWARVHIDFALHHATFVVDLSAMPVPKLCHR